MKHTLLLIAGFLSLASPAFPQAKTDSALETNTVTVKGALRVRGETDSRTDLTTLREFFTMRGRADILVSPTADLKIFFQPQYSKILGTPDFYPVAGQVSGALPTTPSVTATSGTNYDASAIMHQAYLDFALNENLSIRAGREILAFGDDLVVGGNDWNYVGRSFDDLKLTFHNSNIKSDLFWSKISETNSATSSAGDIDFYGLYNELKYFPSIKNFDVYVLYYRSMKLMYPPESEILVGGIRVKSNIESFDYRVEGTVESQTVYGSPLAGQYNYSLDNQLDAEFGIKFAGLGNMRLAIEGFTATNSYSQLFPTGHKWLGYADVVSRKNISGGVVHVQKPWTDKFSTDLDLHYFMRTSPGSPAYGFTGGAMGSAAGSSSSVIGSEADLTGKWALASKFAVLAGASYFMPGAYLTDQMSLAANPLFYYLQLEGQF